MIISWLFTQQVKRFFTRPILHLIRFTDRVSENENYQLRTRVFYNDETGSLARSFNVMLSRVTARNRQLLEEIQRSNEELEHEIQMRHRAERRLTRFQHYLNNIIDSMPSALITVDSQFLVRQCNKEAARLAGLSHDKMVGKPIAEVLPFLRPCLPEITETFVQKKALRIEKQALGIEGRDSYVDLVICPLSGDDVSEAVIRIDDITQRLKLEEVVVQTEKMMSAGGLAAGMAHEITNPLGAVIQGTQNIRRRISADLPANRKAAGQHHLDLRELDAYFEERGINRFLDNIQDAGVRASEIVANMLQFSRQEKPILTPVNLPELLRKSMDIASSDLNWQSEFDFMRIRVDFDLAADLTPVSCIASELQQVLLNLLKNAAHAISQRKDKTGQGRICISARQQNETMEITLSDNGCGMSEEVRRQIFEPFYTTKDIGVGTGLGLSVSYFIITTHHKGSMSVISTPDRGSEFKIRLPLSAETVD